MARAGVHVLVTGDARDLQAALAKAQGELAALEAAGGKSAAGFASHMRNIGSSMTDVGKKITTRVTLPIAAAFGFAVKEAEEANKVHLQTKAIIEKTGGAAKVTTKHVENLANAIKRMSGIDDEQVQAGANVILTFNNIRNEVGKGNQIFDRATKAAVALSQSMTGGFRGDIPGAAKALGKALSDPEHGLSRLTRQGVVFTEQQQDMIKWLAASGHELEAQAMMMDIIESQTAIRAPTALEKLQTAFGDLAEEIGKNLLPAVQPLIDGLSSLANKFGALPPEVQTGIIAFAAILALVGPLVTVIGSLVTVIGVLAGPVGLVAAIILVAAAAIAGVIILVTHWNEVWDALVDRLGVVGTIIAVIIASALFPLIAMVLQVAAIIHFAADNWETAWNAITTALSVAWGFILPVLQALWGIFQVTLLPILQIWLAAWLDAWNLISSALSFAWNTILSPIITALGFLISITWGTVIAPALEAFRAFVAGPLSDAWNVFSGAVGGAWDKAKSITGTALRALGNGLRWFLDRLGDIAGVVQLGNLSDALHGAAKSVDTWGQGLASGGTVGSGFATNGPRAIVGEGNKNYPEFVIPTDPRYRDNALTLFRRLGGRLMASGGIIPLDVPGLPDFGDTGDSLGGMPGATAKSIVTSAWDFVKTKVTEFLAALGRLAMGAARSIPGFGGPFNLVELFFQRYAYKNGKPTGAIPGHMDHVHAATTAGWQAIQNYLVANGITAIPTSTTGGRHAAGSYHYRGMAVDYGDSVNPVWQIFSMLEPFAQYMRGGMLPPMRVATFDEGGTIAPGMNLVRNATGQTETLRPVGDTIHIYLDGKDITDSMLERVEERAREAAFRGGSQR